MGGLTNEEIEKLRAFYATIKDDGLVDIDMAESLLKMELKEMGKDLDADDGIQPLSPEELPPLDVAAVKEIARESGATIAMEQLYLRGYNAEEMADVVQMLDDAGLITEEDKKLHDERLAEVIESVKTWEPFEQEEFFESRGQVRYQREPIRERFGTLEDPCLVPSAMNARIVGCPGGEGTQHDLLWFDLIEGLKHVCPQCGQVFKLVPVEQIS